LIISDNFSGAFLRERYSAKRKVKTKIMTKEIIVDESKINFFFAKSIRNNFYNFKINLFTFL
jgi:hypothetical protein